MPNIFVYPAPGSSDFLAKIKARRKDYVSKEIEGPQKSAYRASKGLTAHPRAPKAELPL